MKKIATLACACVLVAPAALAGAKTSKHTPKKNTVSGLDKEYLMTSMQGDLFEIKGGKIALRKSHKPAVRRLAKRLITDHTKSYNDAVALAHKLGIPVETSPTPSEVWELKMVSTLKGRAFNHWYSSLEVFDHHQDITETKDEIQDGTNTDVRADARQELPVLKTHLQLAEQALAASK